MDGELSVRGISFHNEFNGCKVFCVLQCMLRCMLQCMVPCFNNYNGCTVDGVAVCCSVLKCVAVYVAVCVAVYVVGLQL